MLAADVSREFDPNLVIPYKIPFKKGRGNNLSDFALDWASRFRARYDVSPVDAIRAIDRSPNHHLYYDNAVKFAEYSAGPVFRSDGSHPPNLGELADAAIQARKQNVPLSRHHQLMLKDISRTSPVGETVATFVQSVATGGDPANFPKTLPPNLQRYLRELSLASKGTAKFIQLVPCVVEVICMRLSGTPLSQEANAMLSELDGLGRDGKEVSKFLRNLGNGGTPAIPRKLLNGMRPFLKQALAWTNEGKVPSGLLGHVAEACLSARLGDEPIDDSALRTLAALEATEGYWPQIAAFLRDIAAGEEPAIPTGVPEPIRSNLMRVSLASRSAGVQQPRVFEIISIGIGDPATGIDLFSLAEALLELRGHVSDIPHEADKAIREFEAAAPERAIVAERLRAVLKATPPTPVADTLPIALRTRTHPNRSDDKSGTNSIGCFTGRLCSHPIATRRRQNGRLHSLFSRNHGKGNSGEQSSRQLSMEDRKWWSGWSCTAADRPTACSNGRRGEVPRRQGGRRHAFADE